ncbi:MAG: hypothetical protein ACOX5R_07785 [bacterium]
MKYGTPRYIILYLTLSLLPAGAQPEQPVSTAEEMAVFRVHQLLQDDFWNVFPSEFLALPGNQPAIFEYSIWLMAGAREFAQITVYENPLSAREAFGENSVVFRGLPAQRGNESDYISFHYTERRWVRWISAHRIFQAETQYNSTLPGAARDENRIAEALHQAALEFELYQNSSHVHAWQLYD